MVERSHSKPNRIMSYDCLQPPKAGPRVSTRSMRTLGLSEQITASNDYLMQLGYSIVSSRNSTMKPQAPTTTNSQDIEEYRVSRQQLAAVQESRRGEVCEGVDGTCSLV